jgi:hypothetical protein
MPAKGQINPAIYDDKGNKVPWKIRNRERANAAEKFRRQTRVSLNPEKERADRRKWFLKMKFGITPEIREILIKSQNYKCAICEIILPDIYDSKWAIDHCHLRNFIRGMLCKSCNSALGLFKDNPNVLRKAVDYLDSTSTIDSEPSTEDFICATKMLESVLNASG